MIYETFDWKGFILALMLLAGGIYVANKWLEDGEIESDPNPEFIGIAPEKFEGATYVSNYDADTVLVNIPSIPNVFGYHIPVRLSHIDAPEVNSSDACEKIVAAWGKKIVGEFLSKAKQINLIKVRRDKYFRLLAEIEFDGKMLHQVLLDDKIVAPYEDGPKPKVDWCERAKQPVNKDSLQ